MVAIRSCDDRASGRFGAATECRRSGHAGTSACLGGRRFGVVALAASMLLGALLATSGSAVRAQEPGPSGLAAAAAIEQAMVEAIARAEKSVVSIARVRRSETAPMDPEPGSSDFVPNEFATGVVVDAKGLIVTNAHVLGKEDYESSDFYVTTIDRKTYPAIVKAPAQVKGSDPRMDLAVLQIQATDLTPIKFGQAKQLKKGQIVIALGNPYAIARDGQCSASWGIISNLGRKLGPEPPDSPNGVKPTLHHFGTLIQTDAKLNLGTSGGPLINLQGEMVGLTTSLAALAGYEQAAGYAIPVDETFLRVLEALKAGREVEFGFLGIAPVDFSMVKVLEGNQGAIVNSVVTGTPADQAGLRRGDVVIAVEGEQVHDMDDLMLLVGRLPVESAVRLTVLREGQVENLTAELAKFPVRGRKVVTAPAPGWRGAHIDFVTATLDGLQRPAFGYAEGGVVITEVDPESPAARAGLERNVLITHVGGTRVDTPREFRRAVEGREGAVELRLWRSPEDRPTCRVEPGEASTS